MAKLLALHITRVDEGNDGDDIIEFHTSSESPDMVEITSKFKGLDRTRFRYTLPIGNCPHYVETLLSALAKDVEPFDRVQITSAMFPAVIYDVRTLGDDDVFHTIRDMIYTTFNVSIRRIVV